MDKLKVILLPVHMPTRCGLQFLRWSQGFLLRPLKESDGVFTKITSIGGKSMLL